MTNPTNKQLATEITIKMKDKIEGVIDVLYSDILREANNGSEESRKHLNVKHYQALDRIKMYLAHNIAKTSFYDFDLNKMVANKERKTLIAIHKELDSNIAYLDIRTIWHESLKDIFYKQKEMKKEHEKLATISILARMEIGDDKGFVSIENGKIKVVKSPVDATEFVAVSSDEKALDLIEKHLFDTYSWECRAFFQNKMKGRHIYQW